MKMKKNQLNKEQSEAVNYQVGPLLIVAGAGTGKTSVITERIVNIINSGWAKSEEVLALTFTDKAASEMEERVDRLLPYGAFFDLNISTFHSFCDEILKESGLEIGLPEYKLLNEYEQYILFKKNLDKFNLDYYRPMGNPTKFIRDLLKHFSRCKDEDITSLEYLKYAEDLRQNLDGMLSGKASKNKTEKISEFFVNAEGEFDDAIAENEVERIEEVANAFHVYQNLLLKNKALDFGDLINYCLKIFRERPNILARYQAKYKYILVDEFQDTNWAQYELVKMLAAPQNNITVVGDDDQAIYRFRGAAMTNILEFKKDYPDAKQIFLIENYRSGQKILDLAYDFIKLNNPNRLEEQLKKDGEELSKKLKANIKIKGEVEVICGADTDDELTRVAKKIIEIKNSNQNINWGDFAILARTNAQAKEACPYLEANDLPYKLFSNRGLYSKEPILASINYLSALNDCYDGVALFKALSLPVFNFTTEELTSLNYLAYKKAASLFKILNEAATLGLSKISLDKINKFLVIFRNHLALVRSKTALEIFIAFVYDTEYLKYWNSKTPQENQEGLNFLNQLAERIKRFEVDSLDKTLGAFLDEFSLELEAGEEGNLPLNENDDPETVKIMTVHSAKGLEFKYVFVISLIDRHFPTSEKKEAIKIPDILLDEILPAGDYHLEEERRLFYVAITRAKEGLWLSWSPDAGGKRKRRASRFLVESGLVEDLDIKNADEAPIKSLKEKMFFADKKPVFKKSGEIISTPPIKFSYSQFEAYERCPYQYRFDNILKVPKRGKYQMSFGRTMHSALQKILETVMHAGDKKQDSLFSTAVKINSVEKITLEECLKIYEDCWIDEWYESEGEKNKYFKKGKEAIRNFYEANKNDWPNTLFLEKGFSLRMKVDGEGVNIAGKIDRIDEMPDKKIRIVDYKTGRPKTKLEFADKAQLLIYQQAVSELFKQEIGALTFKYLDDNSEQEFLGNEKDFTKLEDKISETIRSIRKNEFPPKPGEMCKYCDFSGICEFRKL